MSHELQTLETNVIDWTCSDQLKTIKEIYGKKLTNEEFGVFVNLGSATGLNPFLKEIWALKYGTEAASIFIARDGYRKSAQRNENYDYHLADAVYSNDNFKVINGEVSHEYRISDRGNLMGAYCIVKRKSSSKPIFVYVELKEYDKNQSVWKTMKATMIKKVAEAQCLRMAFQELFAGTYSEDEYEPEDNSKSARNEKATANVGNLIEGKSKKIIDPDEIIKIIDEAQTIDDLIPIANMARNLSEEDKIIVRTLYKNKEIELKESLVNLDTGEIIEPLDDPDAEKIKKQLLKAKSLDTLDIAADLISSCGQEYQETLREIYIKRKLEVK